jgi:hypothetical protein
MNDELPDVETGEPVEEAEGAEQPFDPFDRGQAIEAKRQRQAKLARVFAGPTPAPEAGGDLDTLVEAVAQRVLERLASEDKPEPEPDPLTAATRDRLARKQALADVLRGRPAAPAEPDARPRSGGFDGGARTLAPAAPESHDQWLGRILSERRSHGAHGFS